MGLLAHAMVTAFFTMGHASGEVKLIRDHHLQPPRDPRMLFAMAITQEQDVLSFIADGQGKWRLSRVRRWLNERPKEENISVPGLTTSDPAARAGTWRAELLLTPDESLAVCIGSGYHQPYSGREAWISVVRLSDFKIIKTLHISDSASDPQDFRGNYSNTLDHAGHLVIQAVTFAPNDPPEGRWDDYRVFILTLPDLTIAGKCEYSQFRNSNLRTVHHDQCCAALLMNVGASGLEEFLKSITAQPRPPAPGAIRPDCAFLTYTSLTSPDGQFRSEFCTNGHRNFWGNYVVSKAVENIYSVGTGRKVGAIKQPSYPVRSQFASLNGRNYLLVMEGGTRLRIYEIIE